jgi:hypothetical protein
VITSLALGPHVVASCHFLFAFVLHSMCLVHANIGGGVIECHLFDIPKVLLSFHIFYNSNMLEINVYSIIDSNVFSVKIGEKFPLAIVK